jgi:hypothetical protein
MFLSINIFLKNYLFSRCCEEDTGRYKKILCCASNNLHEECLETLPPASHAEDLEEV